AEGHVSRYDKNVYSIMNALGKTNTPARNELAYIRRWTEEFCFELDVILEACGRTVLATDRHRFAYADSILAAWYKAGVHHVADIARLDSSYQKERASRPARSGSTAEYNSFMHSSYDFDALEEALLKQ
ncbi:MAG TPA: DNA replication protein DnaD, partial [Lachnospiraceae bacterium]|nr:DNA replication protein DnaD [Lachnospiraceae bacterium]